MPSCLTVLLHADANIDRRAHTEQTDAQADRQTGDGTFLKVLHVSPFLSLYPFLIYIYIHCVYINIRIYVCVYIYVYECVFVCKYM